MVYLLINVSCAFTAKPSVVSKILLKFQNEEQELQVLSVSFFSVDINMV